MAKELAGTFDFRSKAFVKMISQRGGADIAPGLENDGDYSDVKVSPVGKATRKRKREGVAKYFVNGAGAGQDNDHAAADGTSLGAQGNVRHLCVMFLCSLMACGESNRCLRREDFVVGRQTL